MDKKGILGFDTVKAVFIFFLVLAILAITILLTLSSLRTAVEDVDKSTVITVNETLETVNSTVTTNFEKVSSDEFRHSICSDQLFTNETSGEVINSVNFTLSNDGCTVIMTQIVNDFNNSAWNVSYSATFSNPETNLIVQNVSSGLTDNFFNQTGTIFAILIVVVIILAIGIIIAVVMKFGGNGSGGNITSGGGGSSNSFGSDTVMGV